MKLLCLFAHPDDEAIGPGGTIKKLTDAGVEVIVISATEGGAGEVAHEAQHHLKSFGSVGAMRREELARSCEILGITEHLVLDFIDGEITNQIVWGSLTQAFIQAIEKHAPDFVMTFDHSGWYFHLDHVGVSIAATVATQQAKHKAQGLLLNLYKPATAGIRWKYVFPEQLPATHVVDIAQVKDVKLQAMAAHASQKNTTSSEALKNNDQPQEFFQLVFASETASMLLENQKIFQRTANDSIELRVNSSP